MSLLMDALRKAEAAKQRDTTVTTAKTGSGKPDGLPRSPANSELADVLMPPAESGGHAKKTSETPERSVIRNVFAVKQTPRASFLLLVFLGFIAFLALLAVAYFCWRLQSPPARGQGLPPLSTGKPFTSATPPQTVLPQATQTAVPARTPNPPASTTLAESPRQNKPLPLAENAVHLRRTTPKANPDLEQAYDNLRAGHLEEAQRDYQHVLRSDARNTDALLGLATIAMRQGHPGQAREYYLRALESDPKDPTAQAALISMKEEADPITIESRLKTALSDQPQAATLHFALGNLYARQRRWSEAQQAYFNAYSGEPDNADFVFNLAVSLDQLHQQKLAVQYYQMALNTAPESRNRSFDSMQVKTRILELQP